jgi:hypothetical protein
MALIPANLTPAEQAEFDSLSSDAGVPPGAKPFDPVAELDAAGLAELADNKLFDPVEWASGNYSAALDPATLQKLADANAIIRQKGFQLKDLPTVKEAVGGVGHLFKGAAKVIRNVGSIATAPLVSLAGDITGQGPEFGAEVGNIVTKQAGESVAGIEQAGHGLVELGRKTGGKLIRKTIGTNYGEMTPDQRKDAFLADLGNAQVAQEISVGQGPFTQAVAGQFIEDLGKQGIKLDPAEIADLSAGDPITFIAFGKGFHLLGKSGKVLGFAPTVQKAQQAVATLSQRVAGKVVQAAGVTAEGAGKTVGVVSPALPVAGAVVGGIKGGPIGLLGGLKTGEIAAKTVEKFSEQAQSVGGKITQFGKQIGGEAAVTSPYAQAIRDVIKVAPPVITELAKGAGLDLGLAAVSSETPQETAATSAFGTLFGLAGAAGRVVKAGVQGQLLTARPWGTAAESKPYGTSASLDAKHAAAQQTLPPAVTQRANSIREFLRALPGNVQAYLMPDKAATESFLVEDYTRRYGVAPAGEALANIKNAASQRGMINYDTIADDGSRKRVVLLNDVEAAPHEAFHGIQDVLGDSGNAAIDRIIFDQYFDRWEDIGENYAQRLTGGNMQGKAWRDIITERTGTANPDRYMAREIAAENFDTVFKNLGGSLTEGNSLPQKLARVVAKTMNLFGAEPFSGGQTAGLRLEPKFGVSEEVKRLVSGVTEVDATPLVVPRAPVTPTKPVIVPAAPAPAPKAAAPPTSSVVGVSPDAKAAQVWAANTNDPRLVGVVNNIVANQLRAAPGEAAPVRLKYLSVAGAEGATRTPRRSEQEAAYLREALGAMPAETRQEVEKTHAHVRFDPVKKGNEMQSIGYSLEKIVENAQRAAKWLAGNEKARSISPYAVDVAAGSFTPDAWKQLVSDIQTYTVNQQAGGTGAGKTLKLPKNAAELKISVPPEQAAKLAPLEQSRADFINTLMGLKLPETTRVSRAGGTPGNIVGQEISKANEQPFIQPRVSEPAVQRAGGKEFPGFAGKTIKEVNPLRRQLEEAGFPVNELTEVVERVNLKNLEGVTPAPEVQFRPGVTDTIRAGFLPLAPVKDKPKWLVKGQKGGLKTQAEFEGADPIEARKKAEAKGFRVSSVERSAATALSIDKESSFQFSPKESIKSVDEAADVSELIRRWEGGQTGESFRVGESVRTMEEVKALREAEKKWTDIGLNARKLRDYQAMITAGVKSQFFREAREAATGEGGAVDFIRKTNPDYVPPVPHEDFGTKFISQSPAKQIDVAANLTLESFRDWAKQQKGGFTTSAIKLGEAASRDPELLFKIREQHEAADARFQEAAAKEDIDTMMLSSMQTQFFREADQSATNTGGIGEFKRGEQQFSPKEEDPYAKYNVDFEKAVTKRKTKGGTRGITGWILPNNKLVPLSTNFHEQYLAENHADLNKKFGTKFSETADVDERQQALDQGFIRLRMQSGTLHVEAGQAGWTKAARDKVFETVADNIDNIDQITVSLLDKNGIVKRQGHERLMDYDTDAEKLDNLPLINEGRGAFLPAEAENLPGMDVGREFNRAAIQQMNKQELRAHFPEAIVPRSSDELIASNIVGSPLAKQEGGREAGVEAFASTLADFYKSVADQPEVKAGAEWYSKFTPMLKKEFGKDAPIFAELLAATSPQTDPTVNFGYAFDAYEGFKAGKYDKQIEKFQEGLTRLEDGSLAKIYDRDVKSGKVNSPPESPSDSTYLAHWIAKHNLVPKSSNDKLFGTHSIRVLQVLARKWLELNAGPKTSNFVKNLLGTGSESTIDLWAARTMRRIGYSGFKDRWRILPENATGVSDEDFAFSQEAFRAAADKLGMKPSALQGALWFAEKRLWADRGWGRLNLGDYRNEMKKIPLLRRGIKQREEAVRLGQKAGSAEQEALNLGLTIEPRQSKVGR